MEDLTNETFSLSLVALFFKTKFIIIMGREGFETMTTI